MMTAETRKIRPYEVVSADDASDAQDFGTSGRETGPAALAGGAKPFNDNTRDAAADSPPRDEASDDDTARDAADEVVRARRRGPLVTRWIGFAAQRRRAQARMNRMRDRQG